MTIREILQKAWDLKLSQKIADCQTLIEPLFHALGGLSVSEQNEVRVLRGSILRSLGQIEDSSRELGQLRSELRAKALRLSASHHFELGLIHFMQGDFSLALDEFLASARSPKASGFIPRSFPLTNALLCLENLGMPFEQVYADLLKECAETPPSDGVSIQIEAFALRQNFNKGEFSKIASDTENLLSDQMNQVDYFRFWAMQLPFHAHTAPLDAGKIEKLALSNPFFYQRPYRLRTFQGLTHPSDTKVTKPSEIIDRIYLWTWRWLANPKSISLNQLTSLLNQIPIAKITHRLSIEDSLFLRNSILWISLFDPSAYARTDRILKILQKSASSESPLLELEANVVRYLRAKISGEDTTAIREVLEASSLWSSSEVYFRDLVCAIEGGQEKVVPVSTTSLSNLISNVQKLMINSTLTSSTHLIVNPLLQEIRLSGGQRILSQAMTSAIVLLQKENVVSAQSFLSQCFGIVRYDSSIHQIKILNLLARLRSTFKGKLTFGIKNGFVVTSGSWEGIEILETNLLRESLKDSPAWLGFLKNTLSAGGEKSHVLKSMRRLTSVQSKEKVSRRELEAVIGKSRATTNRLLERWTSEGLLIKEGAARATRYLLTSELKAKLEKGIAA